MKTTTLFTGLSLLSATFAQLQKSPSSKGTVLAVVVFHTNCDRTSYLQPDGTTDGADLDMAGAQQCFDSGAWYFNKYFSNNSNLEIYASKQIYDKDYVNVEVPAIDLSIQSSTAFMQGVFQPVDTSQSAQDPDDISPENNSTFAGGPLGGYQYPIIQTFNWMDPDYVFVRGDFNCPSQSNSGNQYYSSKDYVGMFNATYDFYQSLWDPYFVGVLSDINELAYYNAFWIYDYLNQNRNNNSTLQKLPDEDLQRLRTYASVLRYNLYGNDTDATSPTWRTDPDSQDNLRTIGGRTLARYVYTQFETALGTGGATNKFNVLLGQDEIMTAFFAITNLTSRSSNFSSMPELGSSMVFELYTTDDTLPDGDVSLSSLEVSFGFRNGTNNPMEYWPLFDQEMTADDTSAMSYTHFKSKMESAYIRDLGDWCNLCQSTVYYCNGETGTVGSTDPEGNTNSAKTSNGLSPVVSGIIGAIIMLAIVGISGLSLWCCFGVGVHRNNRRGSFMSGQGIAGIGRSAPKEKMNSDIELPLSPTSEQRMPRTFDDYDDEIERHYGTVSSAGTAVASPLASPQEAHFKAWDSKI